MRKKLQTERWQKPRRLTKPERQQLSLAIRDLRDHLNESQEVFAQRLFVSVRSIARYEGSVSLPAPEVLHRLAYIAHYRHAPILFDVFAGALSKGYALSIDPLGDEEQVWCRIICALLRHREICQWDDLSVRIHGALAGLRRNRGDLVSADLDVLERDFEATCDVWDRELRKALQSHGPVSGPSLGPVSGPVSSNVRQFGQSVDTEVKVADLTDMEGNAMESDGGAGGNRTHE